MDSRAANRNFLLLRSGDVVSETIAAATVTQGTPAGRYPPAAVGTWATGGIVVVAMSAPAVADSHLSLSVRT